MLPAQRTSLMSWIQDLRNLKKIAYNNVSKNSYDYFLEKCYRYYSNKYHTPLHVVREIVLPHDAIIIFYEDQLESMEESQLEEVKEQLFDKKLVVSGDLKRIMEIEDAMDDEAWVAKQNQLLKEQEKKQEESEAKSQIEQIDKDIKNLREKMGLDPKE